MTVVRFLPVALSKRFEGAPRAVLRSGDAALEVVVAERFGLRLRGLAALGPTEAVPLLFPRCRSLHTFWMRTEIDIVWLDFAEDGSGVLLDVEPKVGARRLLRAPRHLKRERATALELAAGEALRLGLVPGGRIELALRAAT